MKRLTALLTTCLLLPAAAAPLDFGKLNPDQTALYIRNLDNGEVLLAHRADNSMNPASAMKLLTAFAAFRALGSGYRWRTEWRSNALQTHDTLHGDLYWIGSGDPVFDHPHLLAMQDQLAAQGITALHGRIVLDNSIWNGRSSADGFEDDTGKIFTTPPDPHLLAYNLLAVRTAKDRDTRPVFLTDPPLNLHLDTNAVTWTDGRCNGLSRHIEARWTEHGLTFDGALPANCIGSTSFLRLPDAARFAEESFRSHWLGQGRSGLFGFTRNRTPPDSRLLAVHHSKPLAEVLTDMNKFSNNIIARTVFMTLGQHENGHGRQTNGEAAIRRQLAASGIDDETLILENGAGLSRRERASARLLGEVLTAAYRAPWRDDFIATLPVGGRDGTLRHRFRHSNNILRLKTGTLRNVRALAGYRLQAGKTPLAVVAVINGSRTEEQLADLDAFLLRAIRTADAVRPADNR